MTLDSNKITNDPTVAIAADQADTEIAVENVPLKDTNGTDIDYTLKESEKHYNYEPSQDMVITDGKRHYTLTNTLPLTTITVNKTWETGYPENTNKPTSIDVKLTRKTDGDYDDVPENETGTAKLTATGSAPTYTASHEFTHLLMYDFDNKLYTYTAEEIVVPAGYTVTTPQQEIAANAENKEFAITNTTKTGTADFTKYDDSYNTAYNIDGKIMAGITFELYLANDTKVTVKLYTDGKYVPDSEATAIITTGNDGTIHLKGLTPNTYYLKEKETPTGYQENTKKYAFTVNADGSTAYTDKSFHIGNEETLSSITLTKQDATDNHVLPNASYWLLRLIPMELNNNVVTEGMTKEQYLNAAKGAIDNTLMWNYWKKNGSYQTLSDTEHPENNGTLTADGLVFGTYLFYEVQAPVGYKVDNSELVPITVTAENAGTPLEQTRTDPRKTAHVNILKTDENGEPLNGAVYALYKQFGENPDLSDTTADILKGKYTTDYYGMNENAIAIAGEDWGNYYFKEVMPPVGYTASKTAVQFTIDANNADELLHIVRANDSQKTGQVTLTKVASGAIGDFDAGKTLQGAKFELYKTDTNPETRVYVKTGTNGFEVSNTNDAEIITGENGQFTVTGLAWGYYLKEVTAPTNFKLPEGEKAKIYFTVGRNNTDGQELICENEPALAEITIKKVISERIEAWGTPTFVFTLTNTANQKEKKIAVEVESGTESTAKLSLEPGTYQISELTVARYKLDSMELKSW